jgi:hypothetical protein
VSDKADSHEIGSAIRGTGAERSAPKGASTTPAGSAWPARLKEDLVAEYNGYCVKCKDKRDFEGEVTETKTGMRMAKGKCPVCGTTVNRILGKA